MRLLSNCLTAILTVAIACLAYSVPLSAQTNAELPPSPSIAKVYCLPAAPDSQGSLPKPAAGEKHSQAPQSPSPIAVTQETGGISGTVMDVYGDVVPGATIVLDGLGPGDHCEAVAGDTGAFAFEGLPGNAVYHASVRVRGFVPWTSPEVTLAPGQQVFLKDVTLKLEDERASVTVYASSEQIAADQVKLEEQQRVLGIIPNFYAVYDSNNVVPLTTKLKFKLAMRVYVDPVSMFGTAFLAGAHQAAGTPKYQQGAKGYGQRLGAVSATSFTDVLLAGAVLPSLLHQDPRYFVYQGTGATKSRLRHALLSPFICRGDNGRLQPNYSSLGGNLASSAIANAYYPESDRGAGLVFGTFAIGTAERMLSGIAQEFILRRLTPEAKNTRKQAYLPGDGN